LHVCHAVTFFAAHQLLGDLGVQVQQRPPHLLCMTISSATYNFLLLRTSCSLAAAPQQPSPRPVSSFVVLIHLRSTCPCCPGPPAPWPRRYSSFTPHPLPAGSVRLVVVPHIIPTPHMTIGLHGQAETALLLSLLLPTPCVYDCRPVPFFAGQT
jgi:hypothetical protein